MSVEANVCPCCGGSLLRHIRQSEVYWFCKTCRQEVPSLSINRLTNVQAITTQVLSQQASVNS
jgi:ribosomal protein L37AE/L43A